MPGRKKKVQPIDFRMPTIRENEVPDPEKVRSVWRAIQKWHINPIHIGPSDYTKVREVYQTPWTYYARLEAQHPGHAAQGWLSVPFW